MVLVFTLIIATTTTKLINFKLISLFVAVIFVMNRLIKSTKYCESATEGGKGHFVKIRCEPF